MRQTLTNANERATQNQPTMRTKQLGSRLLINRPTPTNTDQQQLGSTITRYIAIPRFMVPTVLQLYNSMNFHYSSTRGPRLLGTLRTYGLNSTSSSTNRPTAQHRLNRSTAQRGNVHRFIDETKHKQLTTQTNQLHQIDKRAQTTNT